MRNRNNKLINFILEFSQIALVFLGVYSALMCSATSLELTYDHWLCMITMAVAAVVFYGLFTVLETFRKGKFYGLIGITLFFALIGFRFLGALKKAVVTVVNSFLKEFMNYSGTNLSLLSYTDSEGSTVRFCTNLLIILIGVYLMAWISAFFYRRRRSAVFICLTLPFVVLPLCVGRVGRYSHLFLYLIVMITVIGTRHLRTDATDRRMRQKLAILLILTSLVCGGVFYAFLPPSKYEAKTDTLTQAKNSLVALTTWDGEDILTWFKANFNGDAISYGKIGKKSEITYTGETMLKLSGDINSDYGLYLKGYVGDVYENNRWTSLQSDSDFQKDLAKLDDTGITLENWHTQLRNELGDKEMSGVSDLWKTGVLRIRNLAFGYGNYLVPCLPAGSYKTLKNGRSTVEQPGIDYTVEYYLTYSALLRQDLASGSHGLAGKSFWQDNEVERNLLKEFAEKYYLQVPDSVSEVCGDFQSYLEKQDQLLTKYKSGTAGIDEILRAVKTYIAEDTEYTLAPGKTPSGEDTVTYFLKESKKGYCTYYATTAAVLLRSVGIPTRYVEGMYVSRDELADAGADQALEIPDEDAHAWIEVFDDDYGFVTAEVTPGKGEDDVTTTSSDQQSQNEEQSTEGSDDATEEETTVDATPTPAVSQVPEESMVFDDIETDEDSANQEKDTASGSTGSVILEVCIVVILVLAACELQRRVRRSLFLRNMKKRKPKRRIRMVYLHLVPVWMQYGIAYKGQSMDEFSEEIATALKLPKEEIYHFVELLYHARFGPDTITEEQLQEFGKTYSIIRRRLYDDAKWTRKLYYMYIMVL